MEQNHQVDFLSGFCCLCLGCAFLLSVFYVSAHQRAFDYFTQAANAGNTHAMAFLGKVGQRERRNCWWMPLIEMRAK